MASAKSLLWFLPALAFLAMTLAVAAYRGDELTAQQWLVARSCVVALVALGFVKFSIAGRGIMGIQARWERVLVRWIFLLAVGISVVPCVIAVDYVARILLLGTWASHACAVVTVAVHLYCGWVAVFGV